MDNYEQERYRRVAESKVVGDYYRSLALSYCGSTGNGENGYYVPPHVPPIDLSTVHSRTLIKRAVEQFGGRLKHDENNHIKIKCRYCLMTTIINLIDSHERGCIEHD